MKLEWEWIEALSHAIAGQLTRFFIRSKKLKITNFSDHQDTIEKKTIDQIKKRFLKILVFILPDQPIRARIFSVLLVQYFMNKPMPIRFKKYISPAFVV